MYTTSFIFFAFLNIISMKICKHEILWREKCKEEVLLNSDYCILHIDFPENEDSEDFNIIKKLKEKKTKEKINNFDFNFDGAKLFQIDLSMLEVDGDLNFFDAYIKNNAFLKGINVNGNAEFTGAKIGQDINFESTCIKGNIKFENTKISGDVCFKKANIGNVTFEGAEISRNIDFREAKISGNVEFSKARIENGYVFFTKAEIRGSVLFYGTQIGWDADFSGANIRKSVIFERAKINQHAEFRGVKIGEMTSFVEAKIGKNAIFECAKICEDIRFERVDIGWNANFNEAKIGGYVGFESAKIGLGVEFNDANVNICAFFGKANIGGNISLKGAKIGSIGPDGFNYGGLWLDNTKITGDAIFEKAEIENEVNINLMKVIGELNFKGTKFKKPISQEIACRFAKKKYEEEGNREVADYYFYREMEALRKQKHLTVRYIEYLFMQFIFGYGVHPFRVFITWIAIIIVFAIIFYEGNGLRENTSFLGYLYFSIISAATPGYGDFHPKAGIYQALAGVEAILGTLFWAAFIAIFARNCNF